jgi:hypothetical protein
MEFFFPTALPVSSICVPRGVFCESSLKINQIGWVDAPAITASPLFTSFFVSQTGRHVVR